MPTTTTTAMSTTTTVASAVRRADTDGALQAALEEIGGQGQRINVRIVGRWIERHVGRRIGALRFERGRLSRGLTAWLVKRDDKRAVTGNNPTTPTTPTTDDLSEPDKRAARGGYGGSGGLVSGNGRIVVAPAIADTEASEERAGIMEYEAQPKTGGPADDGEVFR